MNFGRISKLVELGGLSLLPFAWKNFGDGWLKSWKPLDCRLVGLQNILRSLWHVMINVFGKRLVHVLNNIGIHPKAEYLIWKHGMMCRQTLLSCTIYYIYCILVEECSQKWQKHEGFWTPFQSPSLEKKGTPQIRPWFFRWETTFPKFPSDSSTATQSPGWTVSPVRAWTFQPNAAARLELNLMG